MARQRPTTSQVLRRLTLGSGPLKRTSDRLEVLSRLLLSFVALTAVAVALAVATVAYTSSRAEADVQAGERQQVTARLQEDVVPLSDASGNVLTVGRAPAVWTSPSGDDESGMVTAPAGAEAGSTVSIWVDHDGDRTTPPLGPRDVMYQAVGVGILTYLAIAMLAYGAHVTFRRTLDRNRSRAWAAEWALVGPEWTGRVP